MLPIIKLIRPNQWVKNLFVFLPIFFSGHLTDINSFQYSIFAFFAFSFIASAIYCINDIKDVDADRLHPKKKNRPLASGTLSVRTAYITTLILVASSYLTVIFFLRQTLWSAAGIISLYFILNLLYCLKLKQYAIIDVCIISLGFVLRLVLGGIVCNIWLSPWIVCLTFLISLFLAFAKRRDDVCLYEQTGIVARNNIVKYNSSFINQTLGILASVTIVCYIMYSVSADVEARFNSGYVYVTSFFVITGILRYLQITFVEHKSGSPTSILLHDRFIQASIIGWLLIFLILIYF